MSDWWQTMDWKFELVMAGRAVLAAAPGQGLGHRAMAARRQAGMRTAAVSRRLAASLLLILCLAHPRRGRGNERRRRVHRREDDLEERARRW
jgi:hypothetical protein